MTKANYRKQRKRNLIIEQIILRDGKQCLYCANSNLSGGNLTLDHILPQSLGGLYQVNNLVIACRRCNQRRGNQDFFVFLSRFTQDSIIFAKYKKLLEFE